MMIKRSQPYIFIKWRLLCLKNNDTIIWHVPFGQMKPEASDNMMVPQSYNFPMNNQGQCMLIN